MTTSLTLAGTTALIALASAGVSLIVGYPVGHWLASLRQLRRLVTAWLLVPFLLPAFLIGLAFRPLFGESLDDSRVGIVAVVCAHAVMNIGFIAVVTAASSIPREQVEAAVLDGASGFRIRQLIEIPQQAPALSAASLLVALYSATSFGLVVTLGQGSVRTLETEIATAALQRLDLPTAGVLALLQTAMTLVFFLISKRVGATPTALFGLGDQAPGKPSPVGRILGVSVLGVIFAVIGGVFYRAVTVGPGLLDNFVNLAGRGARDVLNLTVVDALGNSLRNMIIASAVSLALAWWLSSKKVGLAVVLPVGISPVVIGLLALVASGYFPPVVAGSWLVLPLVQSIFLTPLAFQLVAPARRSLSREIVEAALVDGATRLQRFRYIELPSLWRPVAAAAALVSLGSLGEFGAARFLTYGSDQTLPLVMFRLMSRPGPENLGMAMTAASVFILVALVVVWAVSRLSPPHNRGVDR